MCKTHCLSERRCLCHHHFKSHNQRTPRSTKHPENPSTSLIAPLEAELVPCPSCHWVSEELINGYRLGRYRGLATFGVILAITGNAGSLVGAWFLSGDPAADRGAIPYFLYGGPAFFTSSAVGLFLARKLLRSRIQPNRNFPSLPKLVPGAPPALVLDGSTGKLLIAKSDEDRTEDSIWIDYQVGRNSLPTNCCDCLQQGVAEHYYKRPIEVGINLRILRCASCAQKSALTAFFVWSTSAIIGTFAVWCIISALRMEVAETWILFLATSGGVLFLASFITASITAPVKFGRGDNSRGVYRLRFRNILYRSLVSTHLAGKCSSQDSPPCIHETRTNSVP